MAVAGFPLMLQGADVSPFANFRGNFSKNAEVKIVSGQGGSPSGKIRQVFSVGKTGRSARLEITGTLTLGGAERPFSALYIFRHPTEEGVRSATVTNLAPGVDDGYQADEGTYTVSSRAIRAEIPFAVGTVTGKAALVIRLKGSRLRVTQTLVTDALTRPIVWRFRGLRSR